MNSLHHLLVVNLASKPFKRCLVPRFGLHINLYFPVGLRNKFLYFLCLVHTKPESWRLTRPVRYRGLLSSSCFDHLLQLLCLESTECNPYFEVKHLASVNRYWFIEIWLWPQIEIRLLNIFRCNWTEFSSVYSLNFRLRDVVLAHIKHFVTYILPLLVTIQPQHKVI